MYTHAACLDDFCCEQSTAVVCGDWQSQYNALVDNYNDNMERVLKYGTEYKKAYQEKFEYFLNMKIVTKKALTQDQFDEIGKSLQKSYEELRDMCDEKTQAANAANLALAAQA